MARTSPETEVVLEVADEIRAMQKEQLKQRRPIPPLGEVAMLPSEYKDKFYRDPQFRQQELQRNQNLLQDLMPE